MKKNSNIWNILCLFGYIVLCMVIFAESAMNGTASGSQSDSFGNTVSDIVDSITEEKNTYYEPRNIQFNEMEELYSGYSYTISVSFTPENCSYLGVSYQSSNPLIAQIDYDGTLHCLKEGEVTITATSTYNSSISCFTNITVQKAIPEDILIEDPIKLEKGNTKSYSLEIYPTIASVSDLSLQYDFDLLDVELLENQTLIITGKEVSNTNISFYFGDNLLKIVEIHIEEEIEQIPVSSITLDQDLLPNQLSVYDSITIHPSVNIDATNPDLIYESSDNTIASISSSGKIIALKKGTVFFKITSLSNPEAMLQTKSFTIVDSVSDFEITNSSIQDNHLTMIAGNSVVLSIKRFHKASYTKIEFISENPNIARIDENGSITAIKSGDTNIICKTVEESQGIEYVHTIHITVKRQSLSTHDNFYYFIRKGIGHFGAFFVLGFLGAFSFYGFSKRKWLSCILGIQSGISVAAFSEVIQFFAKNRGPSISDVILDTMGFLSSYIIIYLILLLILQIQSIKDEN